jgi:tRNA (guanine-N(7)-)-methyltransferase
MTMMMSPRWIPARASTSTSIEGDGDDGNGARGVVDVRRARGRAMDKAWHRTFIKTRPRMSANQKRNYRSLFPRYGLAFDAAVGREEEEGDVTSDGRWRRLEYDVAFGGRGGSRRRVLELGFGLGDNLVESANAMRETHVFVGAEVHRPGVASALGKIDARGLENVLVAEIDGVWLLRDFCDETSALDELVVHFPDPWRGENKAHRRLINPMFIELAERALAPNGRLSIATDDDGYKAHVERVFEWCEPRGWTAAAEPFARYESKYSAKARDEGRTCVDYAFRFAKPSRVNVAS